MPLKADLTFSNGEARTQVTGLIAINQWTWLACQIRFFWSNSIALAFRCNYKSKFLFF
jgi:hypothetical protein